MTSAAITIYPIRTEADHERAVTRIASLIGAQPDTPEGDELDMLATLADVWESRHHPIDPPDPISAIEFRMDQLGLTRRDLEPMIGSRARVSEVLTGKRSLTLAMIRRLSTGLGISADLLIGSALATRHKKTRKKPVTRKPHNSGSSQQRRQASRSC
jgi:HTH-type transcriptional regulator / antitoxin HigA